MKESRKLNNIYKIRVDNIELGINNNRNNTNSAKYQNNDSNNHFTQNSNHNTNNYDFINPSKFHQNNLNNLTNNNKSSNCNCSCTCCCCTKDKNVAQVILSLINKSTKCPKCNSEFYDLSTSFINKSSHKIYKYKNENINDNHLRSSKTNRSYLEKIDLIKNNSSIKTSSPLSYSHNRQDLLQKQNKILTSKLDYSQYIKSPLIQNIKLYKPSTSTSTSKNINNIIESNLLKSKNNREPVQVQNKNEKIDCMKNYMKAKRLFRSDNNHGVSKIINENKNYGTNFFLNVYNINETTQITEHNKSNNNNDRESSARSLKMNKCSNDHNTSQNHNKSSISRNNSILNESNISGKPPPPVKTRSKDLLNQSKLNDSVNTNNSNINKLFIGNTSSLRANVNDNNNTMTNLTANNCGDSNNNNNISRRSMTSTLNNNQTSNVTIQNDDDDDDKIVMDSNIDFTKTMSSNDFSNYIDKIINQFRKKSNLYNSNNSNKEKTLKRNESMNNLFKLRSNEINKPLIPKIEKYEDYNNNNNNSFISNLPSRQASKTSEINNVSKLTADSKCSPNYQQISKAQMNVSQRILNSNDKIKKSPDNNNNNNSSNKLNLVTERRYDFIEGSSFINFTHSYEIEEDDDDDLDQYDEEYVDEDEECENTTTQNEQTINNSSQS